MKKFVAVQDMGLIINRKTAASQIYGAVIMGIAYALFEERIMDAKTGAFLNAEIADYSCRGWATSARSSSNSTSPTANATAA